MTANIFPNKPVNGLCDGRITRVFAENLTGAANDEQIVVAGEEGLQEGEEMERKRRAMWWENKERKTILHSLTLNHYTVHGRICHHAPLSCMSLESSFSLILIVKKKKLIAKKSR